MLYASGKKLLRSVLVTACQHKSLVDINRILGNWHAHFIFMEAKRTNTDSKPKFRDFSGPTFAPHQLKEGIDNQRTTPTMLAAYKNDAHALSFLIKDIEVDLNQRTLEGYSAVDIATIYGRKESVVALIQADAQLQSLANRGNTLEYAARYGHFEILKTLAEFTPHPDAGTLKALINQGDGAALEYLLTTHDYDINGYYDGKTPLLWAVEANQLAMANLLLDRGANIERGEQADKHETPLAAAAFHDLHDMVRLLVTRNANTRVLGEYLQRIDLTGYPTLFGPVLPESNSNLPTCKKTPPKHPPATPKLL